MQGNGILAGSSHRMREEGLECPGGTYPVWIPGCSQAGVESVPWMDLMEPCMEQCTDRDVTGVAVQENLCC